MQINAVANIMCNCSGKRTTDQDHFFKKFNLYFCDPCFCATVQKFRLLDYVRFRISSHLIEKEWYIVDVKGCSICQ